MTIFSLVNVRVFCIENISVARFEDLPNKNLYLGKSTNWTDFVSPLIGMLAEITAHFSTVSALSRCQVPASPFYHLHPKEHFHQEIRNPVAENAVSESATRGIWNLIMRNKNMKTCPVLWVIYSLGSWWGGGGAWVRSSPTGNARESGRMERIGKESEGEWKGRGECKRGMAWDHN